VNKIPPAINYEITYRCQLNFSLKWWLEKLEQKLNNLAQIGWNALEARAKVE
jgi:hypothetical protein